MKTCSTCGLEQQLECFRRGKRYRGGRHAQCRSCENAKARHAPNRATIQRKDKLRARYKMTLEQYDKMLAAQGGVCASCGTSEPGGKGRFHVDHDRSCCPDRETCGKCVRALLCFRCNSMDVLGTANGGRWGA